MLVLYSGGWTRRFFDVLPDSQVAVSSANSFIKLILQRPVIEKYDDDDGFVPVSNSAKILYLHCFL